MIRRCLRCLRLALRECGETVLDLWAIWQEHRLQQRQLRRWGKPIAVPDPSGPYPVRATHPLPRGHRTHHADHAMAVQCGTIESDRAFIAERERLATLRQQAIDYGCGGLD